MEPTRHSETEAWPSRNAEILKSLADRNGRAVFQDPARLEQLLADSGADSRSAAQYALLLGDSAVRRQILSLKDGASQAQMNLLTTAIRSTGLDRQSTAARAEEILYSLGITQIRTEADPDELEDELKAAAGGKEEGARPDIYVPLYVYDPLMAQYREKVTNNEELSEEEEKNLEIFGRAGVGEADYLLAVICGRKEAAAGRDADGGESGFGGLTEDMRKTYTEIRMAHLSRARARDYYPAGAAMGDILFQENEYDRAFGLYLEPGSAALNPERQKNVRTMLRAVEFRKKTLVLLSILFALTEAFIIGGGPLFGHGVMHIVPIILLSLANLAVFGYSIQRFRQFRMKDLRGCAFWFAVLLFIVGIIVA